jgi:glycosyltransferase involved in cell wall biosynthesis
MGTNQIIQVITPGDHFSPSTGSAIPTVVHNFSSVAKNRSISAAVVIDATTRAERYTSAQVIECSYKQFHLNKLQKISDLSSGRLFINRPNLTRMYFPAIESIKTLGRADVLIHNAVPHPSPLRRIAPQHCYYSWFHNDVFRYYSKLERQNLVSSYDGIICVSDYIRNVTITGLPIELQERVHVLQNGVDLAQFGVARQAQPKVTVLFIGRVVPEKGVHVLIDAVVDLISKGHDFNVRIVGRCGFDNNDPLSPYELQLREAALDCKSIEFVPFARREEIPNIMANADIMVVPSIWPDPNPLVVKEGLAAGLAVVCSDIGGIPEMFQDKSLLFSPGDSRSLASVLKSLLQDTQLIPAVGASNRLYVERFTWDKQFDILNRILASK